jgi:hypothetical protein
VDSINLFHLNQLPIVSEDMRHTESLSRTSGSFLIHVSHSENLYVWLLYQCWHVLVNSDATRTDDTYVYGFHVTTPPTLSVFVEALCRLAFNYPQRT